LFGFRFRHHFKWTNIVFCGKLPPKVQLFIVISWWLTLLSPLTIQPKINTPAHTWCCVNKLNSNLNWYKLCSLRPNREKRRPVLIARPTHHSPKKKRKPKWGEKGAVGGVAALYRCLITLLISPHFRGRFFFYLCFADFAFIWLLLPYQKAPMWFFFPLDKSRRLALDFPNCSAKILLI